MDKIVMPSFLKKFHSLAVLFLAIFYLVCSINSGAEEEKSLGEPQPVDVVVVKGAIYTATAKYIERGIRQAEEDGAICIIQIDTPGGLVSSMRDIIENMMASKVPVVVYVYPHGAMATSAGTYITYAAHVAAMAPGTHIGSAHPVSIGFDNKRKKKPGEDPFSFEGDKDKEKKDEDLKKGEKGDDSEKDEKSVKISPSPSPYKNRDEAGETVDVGMEKATNAMVALIRSLAEKHGRNGDWGEKAVRESVSVSAKEAVNLKVVEIYAEDLPDLLRQLKGREVVLEGGKKIILNPSSDNIRYIRMTGIERFLLSLSDPQIAMILMFLGTIGLYFELSTPGASIPGIIGGICIILGLFSLGSLPINYAALALIILSVILFIAEALTPTFGAFTVGGIISFVLGALFLVPAGMPYMAVSRTLITVIAVCMGICSFVIFRAVVKSMRTRPVSGLAGMVGKTAVVKVEINPRGLILIDGELWKAVSAVESIAVGEKVVVEKAEGLTLTVRGERSEPEDS